MVAKAEIHQSEITTSSGLQVELINLGATITSIKLPMKSGTRNVVLSYPEPKMYQKDNYFLGSTCGRYAGRIGHGRFNLAGKLVNLETLSGSGPHTLHGGPIGFSRRKWKLDPQMSLQRAEFRLSSKHGEQGFPGNLKVKVRYEVFDSMKLVIDFFAKTDMPTIVNLANHSYFNLDGDAKDIRNHYLCLNADEYTIQDASLLPTGEIRSVENSPFDLREPDLLRNQISELKTSSGSSGFDHNFVLRNGSDNLREAAELTSSKKDLTMRIFTNQPGLQLYTGQYLKEPFGEWSGLCLETQAFPDSPNQPDFPFSILEPGQIYRKKTVFSFEF
ncbi:MAG: galactose-1-epimerase [Gammaproteobacteria bacterium]|nr:galactose-1-epimerase [Gammaproteobacteria bacterium]